MSDPAIFFDRDGTLNIDAGFVHTKDRFIWTDGAIDAIRCVNEAGFKAIVVTNQSGVARGYYPIEAVYELHDWMNGELAKHSAHIDKFYFCPHHPEGKITAYRRVCHCRKPAPGLLEQAILDFNIDPAKSWMVGDRPGDMDAARAVGVRGLLYAGGNLADFLSENKVFTEVIRP